MANNKERALAKPQGGSRPRQPVALERQIGGSLHPQPGDHRDSGMKTAFHGADRIDLPKLLIILLCDTA